MARVLLADDNAATCSALVLLLNARLGVNDIVTAPDWNHLLELARIEQPQIIFLDWELPACPAHQGLAALRAAVPQGKIIALSARPEACQLALQAGVDAFIAKADPPGRVLEIIRKFIDQ